MVRQLSIDLQTQAFAALTDGVQKIETEGRLPRVLSS
jgi:hypothetical protein